MLHITLFNSQCCKIYIFDCINHLSLHANFNSYLFVLQMSENEVLEPNMSVTLVDNQRIQVLTRSTPTELLPQIGGGLFRSYYFYFFSL